MDKATFFAGLDGEFCPQFAFGVNFDDDISDDALMSASNGSPPTSSTASPQISVDVDDEIHDFVNNSKAKSTVYKDTGGTRRLQVFMAEEMNPSDTRNFWELTKTQLDQVMCLFFMRAKKTDRRAIKENGELYQPDTLNSFQNSWQRVLNEKKIGFDLKTDAEFQRARQVLKSRRKELTKLGLGNKPNATRSLEGEEVAKLYESGYFSTKNAHSLTRVMWWKLSLLFGYRGRDETSKMLFGDVKKNTDSQGRQYLEWDIERGSKTRTGESYGSHQRAYNGRAYADGSERCPVRIYDEFVRRRPKDACKLESRFFLTPIPAYRIKGDVWFQSTGMGKNTIGKLMKEASSLLSSSKNNNNNNNNGSTGTEATTNSSSSRTGRSKISNHCVRKTGISTLLDNGVHPLHVAQHTGIKNPDSLKAYHVASATKRREMSSILNMNDHGGTNVSTYPPSPTVVDFSTSRPISTVSPSVQGIAHLVSAASPPILPVASGSPIALVTKESEILKKNEHGAGHPSSTSQPTSRSIPPVASASTSQIYSNVSTTVYRDSMDSLFRGAILNNCNFYISAAPPPPKRGRMVDNEDK